MQTLDITLRVWTDTETTVLVDPTEQVSAEPAHLRWIADRGRVALLEEWPEGSDTIVFDGVKTTQLALPGVRGEHGSSFGTAFIEPHAPDRETLARLVLPQLLGLICAWGTGDLDSVISGTEAKIAPDWSTARADVDAAVTCSLPELNVRRAYIGFDLARGWTPVVQRYEYDIDTENSATWVVEEWMNVVSGISGEQLSVPKRGRYILEGSVDGGRKFHVEHVVEVDRFELPARIPNRHFTVRIPDGTEVWKESDIPGRPAARYIAGGAQAIAARAAEAAREVERLIAERRRTGVTFDGKPQPASYFWVFFTIGALSLVAGILLRR
ncbi:MAG: hypothetical protein ACF8TS_06710 [Maioricimonas sp. JB049]